jgi:hypothetical protein
VAERDPVRPAPHGRTPATGPLSSGADLQHRLPRGVGSASMLRGGPMGPPGDTGAPLPLSRARTRPGGPREAARRPDGTTTMGRERSPGRGPAGRRQPPRSRCDPRVRIARRDLP